MNHWAFVTGAYVLTLSSTLGLVGWAYVSMRSAEMAAEVAKHRK